MKNLKKILKTRAKFLVGFLGFKYSTIPKQTWGICPWQDINRILQDDTFKVDKSPIQTIFDIGANEGQCAQWMREYYSSPDIQIYSFEPAKQPFDILASKADKLKISPLKVACSSQTERRTLYEYEGSVLNSLNSSTPVSNAKNSIRESVVECISIDDFCNQSKIERIDILKIDTEGFDLEVLKGATKMLAEGKIRFIYFEFFNINKHFFLDTPGSFQAISAFLEPYPFRPITFYTDYVNPLHHVSHFNCLLALWKTT